MSNQLFILFFLITIGIHELGHLLAAVALKKKILYFSIGFWKPYLKFQLFNIEFRLTPWLIGGELKIDGEDSLSDKGFLNSPYHEKLILCLSGITMNMILACLIWIWQYHWNFLIGFYYDYQILVVTWFNSSKAGDLLFEYFSKYNADLLIFSMLNTWAFLTNILPVPSLDGGYIWLPWLEKTMSKERYLKTIKLLTKVGFWTLMIGQAIYLIWFLKYGVFK